MDTLIFTIGTQVPRENIFTITLSTEYRVPSTDTHKRPKQLNSRRHLGGLPGQLNDLETHWGNFCHVSQPRRDQELVSITFFSHAS